MKNKESLKFLDVKRIQIEYVKKAIRQNQMTINEANSVLIRLAQNEKNDQIR